MFPTLCLASTAHVQPVELDLATIFSRQISSVTETILSGSKDTPDVDRLLWKSECGANGPAFPAPAGTVVLLQPLHVRTFYVLFSH